jgi:hypothetical protein
LLVVGLLWIPDQVRDDNSIALSTGLFLRP